MRVKSGLDYVHDGKGKIREFTDLSEVRAYGESTMPKDLREKGFIILPIFVYDHGNHTVRINYAKCLKEGYGNQINHNS